LSARVVDVRLLLRDQQNLLAGAHRLVERENRLLAADEQRNDHVRVHDHVAQRQDRQRCGDVGFGLRSFVGAHARFLLSSWASYRKERPAASVEGTDFATAFADSRANQGSAHIQK
jgi:hypothetical protein